MWGLSEQRLPNGRSVTERTEMRLQGLGEVNRSLLSPARGSGLPLAIYDSPLKRKVIGQGGEWGWEPVGSSSCFKCLTVTLSSSRMARARVELGSPAMRLLLSPRS